DIIMDDFFHLDVTILYIQLLHLHKGGTLKSISTISCSFPQLTNHNLGSFIDRIFTIVSVITVCTITTFMIAFFKVVNGGRIWIKEM
ncbi:28983_t:CDS:1, partial [Racocetra persica]